jgi:glycosyltransferase involved in cell wall biosynthesis
MPDNHSGDIHKHAAMKIAFLTTGNIRRIATMKRALGHARHLADLGWEVSIVAMDCLENRERIGEECDDRIRIRWFSESGAFSEVSAKTRFVDELEPDWLYLCSYTFRNRVVMGRLSKKPLLAVEHSELQSRVTGLNPFKRLLARHFEDRSLRRADHIVCASRYLTFHYRHRLLRSGISEKPVTWLPYAHHEDITDVDESVGERLRREFSGRTNVVYMGSMVANYGLFTMLDAMAQLPPSRKQVLLHLIGEGQDLERARSYAREKGIADRVRFAGFVEERELSAHLGLADAFVAPLFNTIQDWARCPSKTYMYLPFRKPVFTCPVGESMEIFHDPRLFFPSGDSGALADRLSQLQDGAVFDLPSPESHSWEHRTLQLSEAILGTHAV